MPPVERLEKVTARTAAEVARECDLSPEAMALIGGAEATPAAFLDRLLQAGHLADAITFLAFALPKREGAWWAAQAARMLDLGDETALPRRAVRAAEAWVVAPKEPARYAAMDLAEALGFDHAASWAAIAAFWSGDSLLPPDQPKVAPQPHLSCRAVAGAVMLSAAEAPPGEIAQRQRLLLSRGIDIANGGSGRDPAERDGGGTDAPADRP